MNELGISESELQQCDESTKSGLLRGYGRVKGLEILRTHGLFLKDHRDQRRRRKAIDQEMFEGAEMDEEPADVNFLGDNVLVGNEAVAAFGKRPSGGKGISPWTAGIIAGALAIAGAAGGSYLSRDSEPAQPAPGDTVNRTDIHFAE